MLTLKVVNNSVPLSPSCHTGTGSGKEWDLKQRFLVKPWGMSIVGGQTMWQVHIFVH
jgi:hypothetical protein